ncbi:hypothetical protein V6N11_064044 [Hibiscus sabdariffa]|uniref:Uncharacterized protein n=1 Tax=Hibiscus sabdariffa TaxID=183260 RepID=A0ABR2PMY0_9ROSI
MNGLLLTLVAASWLKMVGATGALDSPYTVGYCGSHIVAKYWMLIMLNARVSWRKGNECAISFRAHQQRRLTVLKDDQHWEGPRRGWVKGNVDATVNPSDESAAVGGVFRDDSTDLGKQQSWEGITHVIPPVDFEELVADEQRSWKEQVAITVPSSHCRRVDPGGAKGGQDFRTNPQVYGVPAPPPGAATTSFPSPTHAKPDNLSNV